MPDSAVIFGAAGAIGSALVERIAASGRFAEIYAGSRHGNAEVPTGVHRFRFDLENEPSIAAAAEAIAVPPALVFVATGVLHHLAAGVQPEKALRQLDARAMAQVFTLNAIGPALIAKHFLPRLPRDRSAVFAVLSAKVGSIGDNRLGGWHSYRTSKAALNMMVKTIAVETARTHPQAVVAALHPGTVAGPLSAPFARGTSSNTVVSPDAAARNLLNVIDSLTPADSGGFFNWDGSRLPY